MAAVSLLSAPQAVAQVELSNALEFGAPFLINKYNQNLYYQQLAAGDRVGISYKPAATQFYPTLDVGLGRTRMPLKQFEHDVAFINYNYLNLMLRGNFVMNVFNENTLFLSLGIGFDKLKQKGPGISGSNAGEMKIAIDSSENITKFFPAVGLGMEYVYGESVGRQIYLSVGVNVRYTIMLDEQNSYYTSVVDAQGNNLNLMGGIVGGAVTADFHIILHYMPGKEVFFWKKKD